MLGDNLRMWFELFNGVTIYRPSPEGGHVADGWMGVKDIEARFTSNRLNFGGRPYNPTDRAQQDSLRNLIIEYAGAFVICKLLERRRQLIPLTLDYRLTPLGLRVGNWGSIDRPGFRKRAFFFTVALGFKLYRFRWVITVGALGWGAVNAFRFYSEAISLIENVPFMAWSAAAVAFVVALWVVIKGKLGN